MVKNMYILQESDSFIIFNRKKSKFRKNACQNMDQSIDQSINQSIYVITSYIVMQIFGSLMRSLLIVY